MSLGGIRPVKAPEVLATRETQSGLPVSTLPTSDQSPDTPFQRFQRTKYFDSLDGLRALSILSVVWYHIPDLRWLWRTGYLGVHLFFTISGFLITTLLVREEKKYGKISLRNFYIRRVLRIFPPYYLAIAMLIGVCLFMSIPEDSRQNFYANLPFFLTFTSNWYLGHVPAARPMFLIAWSLATEEQFYLFWPSVIRFSKRWYMPVLVMIALILANQITRSILGYQFFLQGYSWPVIAINSISTSICLGCLLAYALNRPGSFSWVYRVLGQKWSAPAFFLVMVIVSCVPDSDDLEQMRMLYIAIAMVLAVGACVIRADHPLRLLLANPIVRYIGTISYGMYLFHNFAINIADLIPGERTLLIGQFFVVTAITVAMASLSYWLYEKPFLKLKDRFTVQQVERG